MASSTASSGLAAAGTRQVLIVVSDGDDNASRSTLDEVIKQVHEWTRPSTPLR